MTDTPWIRKRQETDERISKIRVLVTYPFLPHYRLGVFRALEDLADFDFEFAADEESVAGILIIDHHELKKRAHLRNVRLGRILWQIGAVSEAARRRHDAYIYVGDASITSTWIAAVIARVNKRPVLFWTIGWHRPETGAKRVIRLTFYRGLFRGRPEFRQPICQIDPTIKACRIAGRPAN